MFYVAENHYSSETSIGFANTWYVVGFATRAARDAHVAQAKDMATRAIKAAEIRLYGGKPGQVSHYDAQGHYWQHTGGCEFICTM